MKRFLHPLVMGLLLVVVPNDDTLAFTVTDATEFGLGIARWDASPHFVDDQERSLDGGLRFSLEGGSYEAYRDLFKWEGTPPTVSEFQSVVETSFAMWEELDPTTRLGTDLRFVPDFGTPVFAEPIPPPWEVEKFFKLNRGAEIDLLAAGSEVELNLARVVIFGDPDAASVTLTSGVSDYPAVVLSGADVYLSKEHVWNLDVFLDVLSHEVGHAILLQDIDVFGDTDIGGVLSRFYDDNYDPTNRTTARETLTNSFARLIDPFDPDNSPVLALGPYEICHPVDPADIDSHCQGDPGIDTPGADLKMESTPNKIAVPLQNDDFAGRQFLYPFVLVEGDFDADKMRTAQDMDLLTAETRQPVDRRRMAFDLTGDGLIDDADREFWVESLMDTLFGDADLNREVNFVDFLTLSDSFNQPGGWSDGDFDGDGDIEFADFCFCRTTSAKRAKRRRPFLNQAKRRRSPGSVI